MLVVPYGWDQPHNATPIERLGAGLHLSQNHYSPGTATKALLRLLCESHFATRAAEIGAEIAGENGQTLACNAIETLTSPPDLRAVHAIEPPGSTFMTETTRPAERS
jgi:UDP:flavonoid glycosyltransferase YjiC (YdhE family)